MPELPFYPAVISVSLVVAAAVNRFAQVPMATAMVLILAGVAISGMLAYRPAGPSASEQAPPRPLVQRLIARAFRLAIGTAVIALAAVAALALLR